MRIVLEEVKSARYVKSETAWTDSVFEAMDFGSSQRAIEYVRRHELEGVQVLVTMLDPPCVDKVALEMSRNTPLKSAA
jgi:hypothetical protein